MKRLGRRRDDRQWGFLYGVGINLPSTPRRPRSAPGSGHTFRASSITEYLRNDGKRAIAQQMANHESARTAGLYDRRNG
jgi:hypothetical protein